MTVIDSTAEREVGDASRMWAAIVVRLPIPIGCVADTVSSINGETLAQGIASTDQ